MPDTTREINEQQMNRMLKEKDPRVHLIYCQCGRCKEEWNNRLEWWRRKCEEDKA